MRIAESVYNAKQIPPTTGRGSYSSNFLDALQDDTASSTDTLLGSEDGEGISVAEKRVLDKVADALARLGRVKRVGLGIKEKSDFVGIWTRQRRR